MLFGEIAYGPIHSRRLGVSLGMEIMPLTHKLCTFNCVYCECGWNEQVHKPVLPTRAEVKAALEKKLQALQQEGIVPDVITFSGNGEWLWEKAGASEGDFGMGTYFTSTENDDQSAYVFTTANISLSPFAMTSTVRPMLAFKMHR